MHPTSILFRLRGEHSLLFWTADCLVYALTLRGGKSAPRFFPECNVMCRGHELVQTNISEPRNICDKSIC